MVMGTLAVDVLFVLRQGLSVALAGLELTV